jgi:hypothetical protein
MDAGGWQDALVAVFVHHNVQKVEVMGAHWF